jgi:hypothetical protein
MAGEREGKWFKGFVFSIDAILAVSIMVIFIAAAFLLIAKSSADAYGNLQTVRLGKDLLAVLEKSGTFALWDRGALEGTMNSSLPRGAGFHLQLDTYKYINGTFGLAESGQYGQQLPKNANVYGARRDFVTLSGGETEYSIARLWIWQK